MSDRRTRQGVRDLNPPGQSNPSRRTPYRAICTHIWERFVMPSCDHDGLVTKYHCGLCQAVRP